MDRLVAEVETKTEEKIETEVAVETEVEAQSEANEVGQETESQLTENSKYLNSFEDMTIAEFKKQEEDKRLAAFEAEKEKLIEKQYEKEEEKPQPEKEQEVSQKIIEKPNYDFIQENDKIVKLSRKEQAKKKPVKKRLGLFLSIALGISAIICISNVIAIDYMASNLAEIEHDLYEVNLPKYLKDIADLDTTKKGMEFVETYPDDIFDAGEAGRRSNWFDKFCNFLSGLFGG